MKVNLLPRSVGADALVKRSFFIGLLILIIAILGSAVLVAKGKSDLANAEDANTQAMARASATKAEYDQADAVMAEPDTLLLARNIQLASAMQQHCATYPNLYNLVRRYVPSFYRLTSISAAPVDAKTCTVTMTGTIDSFQHYADVMLALWRIPGASSVGRSPYTITPTVVPALTPDDQIGTPIPEGSTNIPTDPLQRIDALSASAGTDTYSGVGNFGGDPTETKGATPTESLVTIQVTLPFQLQTPDPQATLSTTPTAAAPASSTTTPGTGAPGAAGPGTPTGPNGPGSSD